MVHSETALPDQVRDRDCSGLQDQEGGAPGINGKFLVNGERGTKYVSTAKKDEVIEMVREQRVKGLQRATRGVAYERG